MAKECVSCEVLRAEVARAKERESRMAEALTHAQVRPGFDFWVSQDLANSTMPPAIVSVMLHGRIGGFYIMLDVT